jgi:ABC-2 type transport system permease protein
MRTIYHIVVKELIQIRRDKRMLGLSLMAPILMLVLLGYAATMDIKSIPMVVCDEDKSSISRDVVNRFTTSGYFSLEYSVNDPGEITHYIENGYVWLALVIPRKFGNDMLAHRTAAVQMIFDGSDANSATISLG